MTLLLLASALVVTAAPARACPSEELQARAATTSASVTEEVASHPAHSGELLGDHSAWSTGLLARRVVADGRDWRFTGQIIRSSNDLVAGVAAPYRLQSAEGAWILATELLEALVASGHAGATLELAGRRFKGDDGEYIVVLTSWRVINS